MKMRNLIRRFLFLNTKRYFIVFYTFSKDGKRYNGSSALDVNCINPFINPVQLDKILRELNKTDEIHVITGFNEVSKKDYKTWCRTDI